MKSKKILIYIGIIFVIFSLLLWALTDLSHNRKNLVIDEEEVKITFKVKDLGLYKVKKDPNYFRTARERAIIVGDTFKVGFEFNTDLLAENKDFSKIKKLYKDNEDYKEVKYSGYKGFQFYTKEYLRYEIYLQISDNFILRVNIYSAVDKKEFTTKELNSKEVKDLLKHMKVELRK